jgi:hypothetical protein
VPGGLGVVGVMAHRTDTGAAMPDVWRDSDMPRPDPVDPDEFFRQMFDPRYPLAWGGRYKPQRGGERQMGPIARKVAFVAGVVSIIAALVMALGGCLLSAEQRADVCGWPEWWSR